MPAIYNNQKRRARTAQLSRARSGFRATYGPDSTQYEQAGGTRASERKRPSSEKPPSPSA